MLSSSRRYVPAPAILLIIILSGCAAIIPFQSQQESANGADLLIVRASDEPQTMFNRTMSVLEAQGFGVTRVDRGYMSIEARKHMRRGHHMRIHVVSRHRGTTELALYAEVITGDDELPMTARRGHAGARGRAFSKLEQVATSIEGGEVVYLRRLEL
jgi:hypothetical protein